MASRPADSELFLGLDVGTSGVKAILVNGAGDIDAAAFSPLSMSTPEPGWAEQDPADWWAATQASIRSVLEKAPGGGVASIGIAGQMHSSVFLDTYGEVIRPALLWCDGRTTAECAEITERAGGEARLRELACNPALEGFTLPKVLWLRRHEPAAFRRVSTVLLPKDFIRFRLTGELASEPSDASGTLMFDTAARRWSEDIIDAVDLPRTIVPDIGGSSEVLGRITTEAAALTGLTEGTPVVGGGADNACGAAGVGAVMPGMAVSSWGTSGTVLAPTSAPVVDPGLRAHTFCHVAPDIWYVMGVVLSAGGAFAWYRDRFAREYTDSDAASAALNEEAARAPRGAGGVTFLPYLQGERTPHRDASLRGVLSGLSLAHGREHITRAVLEGICFALRDSLVILQELGLAPDHVLVTGGGARSPFIRQLQAEVFGLPVRRVNREEGPAYGAALLASVGAGRFSDLAAAAAATLVHDPPERPATGTHEEYSAAWTRYRSSYPAARRG